jgi:TonB family protein
MRFSRIHLRYATAFLAFTPCVCLHSQSLPSIQKVSEQIALEVEKTGAKQILVAPQEGCLLDSSLCEQFESNLRSAVPRVNPEVQFVSRGDLLATIKNQGLVALDVYDKQVLVNVASDVGAEALVEENLAWQGDHYELQTQLYAAQTGQIKKQITAKVATSISGDEPLVYRDPESGISLIVSKRKTSGFRVFRYPDCVFCRMPDSWKRSGPRQSVALRMTITNEGQIQQIVVVRSSSQKAAEQTLEAVNGWRFKPAIDSDGNAFSARILVTLELTAPLCPAALPERGDPARVIVGPPGAFQPCPVLPSYYPPNHPGQF